MMNLTAKLQLVAPVVSASDLERMREVMSLTADDVSDSRLQSLFLQAASAVEEFCGRIYRRSKWQLVFGGTGRSVFLPIFPVYQIDSVLVDGVEVESGGWKLLPAAGGWRLDLTVPAVESLAVDIFAGYGEGMTCPPVFDAVVLSVASDLFEHREAQSEINLTGNKTISAALASLAFYNAG